jgi:uncharacterized membrane protein
LLISIFAFAKFLFLNDDISCVNFIAVLIRITSCLYSADNGYLYALVQIFFSKLSQLAKCYTVDKIGCRLSFGLEFSIDG